MAIVKVKVKVRVRFRVYLLHLLRFHQTYCTLVVRNCYVTGGVLISFLISRSTGVSIATALFSPSGCLGLILKNPIKS